jgi:tetratricopeptide (TPR) repeat protein
MKRNGSCAVNANIYLVYMSFLIIFVSLTMVNLLQFPSVLAQNATNFYDLYKKGLYLDDAGNYTGAISYYDKALAINPNYINALDNKGVALDKLGNHTGAISYFDQSLDINPSDINALNYKNVILKILGNHSRSIN